MGVFTVDQKGSNVYLATWLQPFEAIPIIWNKFQNAHFHLYERIH